MQRLAHYYKPSIRFLILYPQGTALSTKLLGTLSTLSIFPAAVIIGSFAVAVTSGKEVSPHPVSVKSHSHLDTVHCKHRFKCSPFPELSPLLTSKRKERGRRPNRGQGTASLAAAVRVKTDRRMERSWSNGVDVLHSTISPTPWQIYWATHYKERLNKIGIILSRFLLGLL